MVRLFQRVELWFTQIRKLFFPNGISTSTATNLPTDSTHVWRTIPAFKPGQSFQRYTILQLLGQGNMGVVYLGQEKKSGRQVALKFLDPKLWGEREALLRFRREAYTAAQIIHPNIVTVYELHENAQPPFIVMEYVAGETLRKRLDRLSVSPADFFHIAGQIADGMRSAHRVGAIHRDLKPDNILLNREGRVKIVDFGLAKIKSAQEQITYTSAVSGTPPYMSPEQWEAGEVDQRSDIFTLGVIFYEMIAGMRPFINRKEDQDSLATLRRLILYEEPPTLAHANTEFARWIWPVLKRALEKHPLARFQNMEEFLDDLQHARASFQLAASDAPTFIQTARPQTPAGAGTISDAHVTTAARDTFYIERAEDRTARNEMARMGVTISIKGPRQIGKTLLLRHLMQAAQQFGKQIVSMDFQEFDQSQLENEAVFFKAFSMALTHKIVKYDHFNETWQEYQHLGNIRCSSEVFETLMLRRRTRPLTLAMDNVDRILGKNYSVNFFSMLRAWHNRRQDIDPIWQQLDLVLATSTEPTAFIADQTRSPFNVGRVVNLHDFNAEQSASLNEKYGAPLSAQELQSLQSWVGGHPYLLSRAFELVTKAEDRFQTVFEHATDIYGPFGDHLRPLWFRLNSKETVANLKDGLRQVLHSGKCEDEGIFYRLQAAGLVSGDARHAQMRCRLYEKFFGERLYE